MPTIVDPRGRHLSLSRSGEIAILDMDGRELSTHRVPYGAHLLCESGHIVSRGDRIAEWDPSFSPVITEKAGTVKYQDLIENRTMTELVDESTGITQRVVTDDTTKSKKDSLHPRLPLTGAKAKEAASTGSLRARSSRSRTGSRSKPARCSPYAARSGADARHHRRSAARRRAVRGAQAEGECDHRQGLRQGHLHARL
jgi:hypothetical protein